MGAYRADRFLLIGLSHKTAPVEEREKFSLGQDAIPPFLDDLSKESGAGVSECILLSTCNRTELYCRISGNTDGAAKQVLDFITGYLHESDEFRNHFYIMTGAEVIEHLFRVVSGIDSMIMGEPQIFGQVKSAYSLACDYGHTGPAMNRLFHRAFQVGKQVRSITSIGEGAVSIGSAAVILAQQVLGDAISKALVVLVGAGKIGELCARQLAGSGSGSLCIVNRTRERAVELTCRLAGKAAPFEELPNLLADADIVITSVSSPEPVISRAMIVQAIAARPDRTLVLIDLGVPRNVESALDGLHNVRLFNIDDLESVVFDNRERRQEEAGKAEAIIGPEVDGYMTWLKEREVVPVIQNLHAKCEDIRQIELGRVKNRVDDETYKTLDLVTRRIIRKILHNPTVTVRASESGEARNKLIATIHELFIRDAGTESGKEIL